MEEDDNSYVPVDSPMDAQSYVKNLLIYFDDDDDEEEVDSRLHVAALAGDADTIKMLLSSEDKVNKCINHRVRPFLSTPLRLAVTGGHTSCVKLLLEAGAAVDLEDIKGQTPLLLATSLGHLSVMEELLKYGANPEGSPKNRGSPLLVAVRDGFSDGVKLLIRFGVKLEPYEQLVSCVPGWPLHHAIVYSHFSCFLALLQAGASSDLNCVSSLINPSIIQRLSIPHAILKYAKDFPEFVHLYHECGGNLRQTDQHGRTALEVLVNQTSLAGKTFLELIDKPLSLKALSRQRVRSLIRKHRFSDIYSLDLPATLRSYLSFEEYNKYALKTKENTHAKLIKSC